VIWNKLPLSLEQITHYSDSTLHLDAVVSRQSILEVHYDAGAHPEFEHLGKPGIRLQSN